MNLTSWAYTSSDSANLDYLLGSRKGLLIISLLPSYECTFPFPEDHSGLWRAKKGYKWNLKENRTKLKRLLNP